MSQLNVKLPELGEGVTEGELVKWLVKIGDTVQPDQIVAEVMTDKATIEIPTNVGGVVKELKFNIGQIIPVETVILILDSAEGGHSVRVTKTEIHPHKNETAATAEQKSHDAAQIKSHTTSTLPPADFKVLATPSTRRLAREMSVDINQVSGTGPAGRVLRDDVLKGQSKSYFVPTSNIQGPQVEEREPLIGIRRIIAEKMQNAKRIVPHFTLMDEADVTRLVDMRESIKNDYPGVKITYMPFVIKALIASLEKFPMINASIDDEKKEIIYKKYYNIGFAADTPQGLMVPVIKRAEHKSVLEISQEISHLADLAKNGKLKTEDMKGATISITNIGAITGTYATPIINHPEVAILGMYKISDKPILKDGQIHFIKSMNFTITADHRLIDGAVAARFLSSFISLIQKPASLFIK